MKSILAAVTKSILSSFFNDSLYELRPSWGWGGLEQKGCCFWSRTQVNVARNLRLQWYISDKIVVVVGLQLDMWKKFKGA